MRDRRQLPRVIDRMATAVTAALKTGSFQSQQASETLNGSTILASKRRSHSRERKLKILKYYHENGCNNTCTYLFVHGTICCLCDNNMSCFIDKIIHGSQYLRGHTIQEVRGEVAIGPSIYGVYVIDGSLCSRVYGIQSFSPK